MTWKRSQRLEALIKELVATVVVEHLSDPALGFVTILRVELSDDKRIARVFYTVLGEPSEQRRTIRAIERAAPHVQERIAPSLRVRYMPKLHFVIDDSLEGAARYEALLAALDEFLSYMASRLYGIPIIGATKGSNRSVYSG